MNRSFPVLKVFEVMILTILQVLSSALKILNAGNTRFAIINMYQLLLFTCHTHVQSYMPRIVM